MSREADIEAEFSELIRSSEECGTVLPTEMVTIVQMIVVLSDRLDELKSRLRRAEARI